MTPTENIAHETPKHEKTIWLGVAVGMVVGIGIAVARRKKSRWDTARAVTNPVGERSGELADATVELAGRLRNVVEEGLEGAGHLWTKGRKLVGY